MGKEPRSLHRHPAASPEALSPGPTTPAPHHRLELDTWTTAPVEGLPATCPGRKPPHLADTAVLPREKHRTSQTGKEKGNQ